MSVLVADGLIQEISAQRIAAPDARKINVDGRTLMPGLIDCHVHAFFSNLSLPRVDAMGPAYRTAHAVRMLQFALQSGFTTVRDIGGGNFSLYKAIVDGLIEGPRYFYSGKVLSMTGGHADMREMEEVPRYQAVCACAPAIFDWGCVIADGVDEVLKATREELRQGAHCIKLMGSGGVSSPTDPVWMNQYREDEIRTVVNECTERRSYASAHCHPTSAVRRCVDFGVRCIEHATFIDFDTAQFVVDRGAYIVPTMVILEQLVETGARMGFPSQNQEKAEAAWKQSLAGLDIMRRAGVKLCYGTDLIGDTYRKQCREFTLRAQVFTPLEILRQATSVGAEMMMQEGKLGCVSTGAHADLIVVDGDPLRDVSLLDSATPGAKLSVIMLGGKVVKCEL